MVVQAKNRSYVTSTLRTVCFYQLPNLDYEELMILRKGLVFVLFIRQLMNQYIGKLKAFVL
jgi:hypothetical protein